MAQHQFHITIIGGGMVGMSLALMLAQQQSQLSIALIDAQMLTESQQSETFHAGFDARSTAIARGSMEIFEQLGIWPALEEHATPIKKVHVSDSGHFMGGLINAEEYEVDAVGYVIPNEWISRVVLQHIRRQTNIHLMPETRVEKLIPKGHGVELVINSANNTQSIFSSLAVLADGGSSALAKQLGIEFSIEEYHQSAIIANVAFSQPHKHIAYERFTESGPIALLPLGKSENSQESALVFTLPHDIAQDFLNLDEASFLKELQKRFGYRLGEFISCSRRHLFELKLVKTNEQIRSGLVLIGNAAHFLHPVAGQGFNLSLRDCNALCSILSQNPITELGQLALLQDYLRQREADQNKTIFFSDQLVKLFSSSRLPAIALRHLGFMSLESMPPLKKLLVKQTMGKVS